eukprot:CAMPEP_0205917838 /NCGR_PEP_ID=MMETSP1325-20131115/9421_1 /ASSEMBLY_ACC=CAM_ASM_000708 /TAXON_ID=236786 /ORGANISM="Florenciella sp., Strain RCC1007" /LENGTH=48 /DNA_ID= /DNA_START= /DNA_END= /DNA_ORIENTATION=
MTASRLKGTKVLDNEHIVVHAVAVADLFEFIEALQVRLQVLSRALHGS